MPYELIIVDNHSSDGSRQWLVEQDDIRFVGLDKNIKHGPGLDLGISLARYPYILVMDIDAHLQRDGWDADLFELYESDEKIKLIAAKGGDPDVENAKPIHACFQFFERRFFKDSNLSFVPRDGHDVGRKNYYDIVNLGYKVYRIPPGYEMDGYGRPYKFYGDVWGDEFYLKNKIFIFHNWYASRITVAKEDKIDKWLVKDIERKIDNLFEHELVKEILNFNAKDG